MMSYLTAGAERHSETGFTIYRSVQRPKPHLDLYVQVIYTEFFCTIASEHCIPVQRTRPSLACREKESRTWRVWGLGGGLIGRRKLILHKYLLFPAALAFLSVGIRESVQMCLGAALAITGIVIPTAFIGL